MNARDTVGEELVVLVDESGAAIGTAPKATVHHADTPLHLAFSCYVFDSYGNLLLTQRALHKRTFPGLWTNSVCGHPAPGEEMYAAVARRARQELGIGLTDLQVVLPSFRYQATAGDGVREHELCPVFTARTSDPVVVDRNEVEDTRWTPWTSFRDDVFAGRVDVSPWCVTQVGELAAVETEPLRFMPSPEPLPDAALGPHLP